MKKHTTTILKLLIVHTIIVLSLICQTAMAHEPRSISGGAYNVAVGWRSEPAYERVVNAFDFIIKDNVSIDTIQLDVKILYLKKDAIDAKVLEKETLKGELRRDRTNPNRFNIALLPTEPGAYGFHLKGMINGISVDELFVCRGGTQDPGGHSFGCVIELQNFPDEIDDDHD